MARRDSGPNAMCGVIDASAASTSTAAGADFIDSAVLVGAWLTSATRTPELVPCGSAIVGGALPDRPKHHPTMHTPATFRSTEPLDASSHMCTLDLTSRSLIQEHQLRPQQYAQEHTAGA